MHILLPHLFYILRIEIIWNVFFQLSMHEYKMISQLRSQMKLVGHFRFADWKTLVQDV